MTIPYFTRPSDDEQEIVVLYPELGPVRSSWRERRLRFRTYIGLRDQLMADYPESWVAVVRGDRVIVGASVDELREQLLASGYDPEASVIKYMFTGRRLQDSLRGAARTFVRGDRRI